MHVISTFSFYNWRNLRLIKDKKLKPLDLGKK